MLGWLLVALGGALGSVARFAVDRAVIGLLGPTILGTFLVNVSGSFLLGVFVGLVSHKTGWPIAPRLFLAVGFLGAYTTFSTLAVNTVQLMASGLTGRALLNLVGSVGVGVVASLVGIAVGRWL